MVLKYLFHSKHNKKRYHKDIIIILKYQLIFNTFLCHIKSAVVRQNKPDWRKDSYQLSSIEYNISKRKHVFAANIMPQSLKLTPFRKHTHCVLTLTALYG